MSTQSSNSETSRAEPRPPAERPDAETRKPGFLSGLRAPFEPWRKIMLAGAGLLLLASIVRAVVEQDLPALVYFIVNFVGYGLLAVGFLKRMRARRTGGSAPDDPNG